MSGLTKRPIQLYLRPDQLDRLRLVAARRNVSIAELVRQGVDRLLDDIPLAEDPLLEIIGLVDAGPTDLAERHDDYLADAVIRENT